MARHDLTERYGIRLFYVHKREYVGIADEPLIEERIRESLDNKHNAQLQERHNDLRRKLIHDTDDKIFVADSLAFVTSLVTHETLNIPARRLEYEEINEALPLSEKERIMRIRQADANLTLSADTRTLSTLNKAVLKKFSDHLIQPEENTPDVFYRAFRFGSYSRYDKDLGFRSSNQPFTLPSSYEGPLHESSLVDKDGLKNHCEGTRPSDLIAMSDSPARILRFVEHPDFNNLNGKIIAVIDVSKLLAMRVLFCRTTTLADKLGMGTWTPSRTNLPNLLNWANPNYWVVYRWIPAECIKTYISVEHLQRACKEHNIGK